MGQENLNETYAAWGKVGGFVGFAITIYLFGFGSGYSGAQGLLIAGAKGFVGAGLGAGIFYCVAGLIYSPEAFLKVTASIMIIIFSAVAIFLLYMFSPKFNELVENAPVEVLSDINDVESPKANYPREIVVIVKRDGEDLRMSTNSIHGLGTDSELIKSIRKITEENPRIKVLVHSRYSKEDTARTVRIFKLNGIRNAREATKEDWLRLQNEWDNRK